MVPSYKSTPVFRGFPLRQRSPRTANPEPPPAPERFTLSRGLLNGILIVRSGKVPKAGSYDAQIATADPTVEANWTDAGSFKNCRRIQLQGLTPGKVYSSVRLRARGTAGPGRVDRGGEFDGGVVT